MSQLLGRIAKLSSAGMEQRLLRSLCTAATPYLLFKETNYRAASGGTVVDINLYDPRKKDTVKVPDQNLSKELQCTTKIGSSRGWVVAKNVFDSTLHLTNIFNPCASVSSHKVINLPPLDDSKVRVSSISLSASPNQQDCVVAAKSSRSPFLSLWRPGDSDWTRIKVPAFASKVMYSARDRKFYLHSHRASKEEYEGPIDLINTSSDDFTQVSLYQRFPNSVIPESRQDLVVSSPIITQYLVESPSGDCFIVFWCNEYLIWKKGEVEPWTGKNPPMRISHRSKPRTFVVFRQDREQGIGSYTEDIGDLCIFLGQREAFCVSATEYPGLHPNSVYYASSRTGFGYYDLSSNTLHDVIHEASFSGIYTWLAPLQ